MNVLLINTYELGRQPFGLAEPAAWLQAANFAVCCLDLSIQRLEISSLSGADLIGIYVPMHTATRIAAEIVPRIRELAPAAHLCVFGLYASMNEQLFRSLGVETVLGGEFEPGLLSVANRLRDHVSKGQPGPIETGQPEPIVNLSKIAFRPPERTLLPELSKYARLIMPDGARTIMGFAEATRGCKHFCRHCPIVPVYQGRFRVVPVNVVIDDIRTQIASGAEHISFGDPDFLNGPMHAKQVVSALQNEFPGITYDVTIKIQHLLLHKEILPLLKRTGCVLVTSAVESVDDKVLGYFQKDHTNEDFGRVVTLMREAGIALAPTFVAFTPWTTLRGYINLLSRLIDLELVESVSPIQLAIRLLLPRGSHLLPLVGNFVGEYDSRLLGYPWCNPDRSVDAFQAEVQAFVESVSDEGERGKIFEGIWNMAHRAIGERAPSLPESLGERIPRHSEPWYCCAEPTTQQLRTF